jgi:starch phosphorylase
MPPTVCGARSIPCCGSSLITPGVVLQTIARDQIEQLLADSSFRKNVDELLQARRHETETPAWFQQKHPKVPLTSLAHFSMEFMLSEALPIYSGGLGNVAGDQLKAASDLGVPVAGVGLLYQQGYFRQVIDRNGEQQTLYPYNDPGQLPITPLRQPNGERLRLEIALPGYSVWLRSWQVRVGRVKLYLLDSNDAANFPAHREITSELYGGSPELRLKQELLLGIGGWRLLRALGLQPELNPDELLNADLKQKVTTAAPARTKRGLTQSAVRALRSVQKQPQRVRNYFREKDVSYAA